MCCNQPHAKNQPAACEAGAAGLMVCRMLGAGPDMRSSFSVRVRAGDQERAARQASPV